MFSSFRKDLLLLLERSWVKGTSNPRSFIQSGMDMIWNVSPCEDACISSSLLLLGCGLLVSQLIAWGAYQAGLELQALSPQTLETGRIPAQFSVSQLCFQNYRCLMGHGSQTLGYIRINWMVCWSRFLGLTSEFLTHWIWGGAWECAFLTSSQVLLLTQCPHLENHHSRGKAALNGLPSSLGFDSVISYCLGNLSVSLNWCFFSRISYDQREDCSEPPTLLLPEEKLPN